jgi:soluble lytic murein transglycosylase
MGEMSTERERKRTLVSRRERRKKKRGAWWESSPGLFLIGLTVACSVFAAASWTYGIPQTTKGKKGVRVASVGACTGGGSASHPAARPEKSSEQSGSGWGGSGRSGSKHSGKDEVARSEDGPGRGKGRVGPDGEPAAAREEPSRSTERDAVDVSEWSPYFQGRQGEGLDEKLNVGDVSGALAVCKKIARKEGAHAKQARFLVAYYSIKLGKWAEALPIVTSLLKSYPLFEDRLRVMAGLCHLRLGQPKKAIRSVHGIGRSSASYGSARLVEGAALRKLGRWKEAAKLYVRYLNSSPRSSIAEARARLAQCLIKTGGRLARILTQLRLVERDYPWSRWAKIASSLKAKALKGRPQSLRDRWRSMPCGFAVIRAHKLMRASRHTQAAKELREAIARKGCSKKDRCKAAYYLAQCYFKTRKRKRSAPLFMRAVRWCEDGGPKDIRAKAKYQAGRANRYRRRYAVARAYFRRVEREHPHHSYADDARLRLAETWKMAGEEKKSLRAYRTLVKRYPKGDMRQEALWRLVRHSYFAGDMKETLRLLRWSGKVISRERRSYAEGRTSYWTGRVLARLGRKAEAAKAYERTARTYPLSYYALLAVARLEKIASARAEKIKRELGGKGRGRAGASASSFELEPDATYRKPAFRRGVELARLGLGREALAELRRAGVKVFRGGLSQARKANPSEAERRRLWAATVLLDSAGLYHLSHWTPRHILDEFRRSFPRGENRKKWRLAYPLAFEGLVRKAASRFGLPPELLFGIMREESAFNPRQISRAQAVGLVQLLVPTGKRFARGMGVEVTKKTLKKPEINIPIGARFLAYLLASFGRRKPLAVAGYNAGEHRIVRWVKRHRKLEVDELVELIPFDQTRRYTKRVLSSVFAYRCLENPGDPAPAVSFALPKPKLGRIPPLPRKPAQTGVASRPE